jgi:CRP-like cAMP-binding protein
MKLAGIKTEYTPKDKAKRINHHPFLTFLQSHRQIPDSDLQTISDHLAFRRVESKTTLLEQGRIANELFFICKGILKIVTNNEKGNAVTQFFLKENQFCTILHSFENGVPAHESIVTAIECELVVIPKQKLLALFEKLPYLKELIMSIMHRALLDKIAIRNAYMGEDAASRYETFLTRQPEIALRVPLSDVASYLGITQQSLSRIRKNVR